mmetsp:Transcript_20497/g.63708  ORF Transcript_20497/g.63708 Transcript_20497/m.63708 type:complete len:340 (-) Transcript_20497:48-1067(-)
MRAAIERTPAHERISVTSRARISMPSSCFAVTRMRHVETATRTMHAPMVAAAWRGARARRSRARGDESSAGRRRPMPSTAGRQESIAASALPRGLALTRRNESTRGLVEVGVASSAVANTSSREPNGASTRTNDAWLRAVSSSAHAGMGSAPALQPIHPLPRSAPTETRTLGLAAAHASAAKPAASMSTIPSQATPGGSGGAETGALGEISTGVGVVCVAAAGAGGGATSLVGAHGAAHGRGALDKAGVGDELGAMNGENEEPCRAAAGSGGCVTDAVVPAGAPRTTASANRHSRSSSCSRGRRANSAAVFRILTFIVGGVGGATFACASASGVGISSS